MSIIKKNKLRERNNTVLLSNKKVEVPVPKKETKPILQPEVKESTRKQIIAPTSPQARQQLSTNLEQIKTESSHILKNLESELQQRRAEVETECDNLRARAINDVENIKKKAYQEGLEQGKADGQEEYVQKSQEIFKTINEAVKQKNRIIKEAEGGILKLAINIAEQIIRSEISLNQAVCLNIVAEAVNKITDRDQVIVKVNTIDLELVKRNRDRLASLIDGVKSFSIVEDSQVGPGGCIVETNLGYIDARIATKLQTVEGAFMKVHNADKAVDNDDEEDEQQVG
ncbi:MAG: FliH/SctL family protein [Candidatus Margulisiibacteriota bacterium]